jgi:UDP-N-acetylmuramoyl-L-alanyl-D-glutamate--2,6-diaminopimelate ligase
VSVEGISLRELFAGIELQAGSEVLDIAVTDISANSGLVEAGGLFLACSGFRRHGLEFLDEALDAGVGAIAWEPGEGFTEPRLPAGIAGICVPHLGDQVGIIADRFFASPSSTLAITGITGTNGKTTTAWLVTNALLGTGVQAGYMGTLGFGIGQNLESSALTTPGCIAAHRRLRKLSDVGATAVAMEVSSHGLDQGRIDGVKLRTAAFTNLSRDHLDYHGSFDAYKAAKATLFEVEGLESAVINIGDPFGAELARKQRAGQKTISVALVESAPGGQQSALCAELLDIDANGMRIRFTGEFGTAEMHSSLWGTFNVENLLVAAGILLASDYELDAAAKALENCQAPPGRMQVIRGHTTSPLVVVDFAHTPDALAKALIALREHCDGQVGVVFGCGGNRDEGKRAEMGAAAATHADRIIVTDDNPRDEHPAEIATSVVAGAKGAASVEVVHDRAAAIQRAIEVAGTDDAILIAGKGAENFQLVAGRRKPFCDADVAADVLGVAA